jgi:hypothetical protein
MAEITLSSLEATTAVPRFVSTEYRRGTRGRGFTDIGDFQVVSDAIKAGLTASRVACIRLISY